MANYLVIAASSTIGQKLVAELRQQGHSVLTTARDNSKITPDFILDATDFNAVDKVFTESGQLDGVVNCSGSLLLKPAHLTNSTQYDQVIASSLTTAFATVRSAGNYMRAGGSVVLISSAAAITGISNHEAIAAAKAGIIGLMRSAAATYGPINLRFNAIAPGLVDTSLTQNITKNSDSLKFSLSMHALKRIGTPEEISRLIAFLLDPANSWITGQVIGIDGGLAHLKARNS
jgi:NAD(P)-dependent dehydrogenase (short-subunit alcohol dehydrogenase family)